MRLACIAVAAFGLSQNVSGQGFINLGFENANVTPTPLGGWGGVVDPALAFPGWTVLPNSNPYYPTSVGYNNLSIGGPCVFLMGPNIPNGPGFPPLQGSYSVLIQYFEIGGPPVLSQSGLVPASAKSINFLVGTDTSYPITPGSYPVIALNGITIPLVSISGGRVAGDVSAFAGVVSQLTISTPVGPGEVRYFLYFDDFKFSSASVPEPSTLSLFGVCILLLGWRMKRRCHASNAN